MLLSQTAAMRILNAQRLFFLGSKELFFLLEILIAPSFVENDGTCVQGVDYF